jgi:hypothetical protein
VPNHISEFRDMFESHSGAGVGLDSWGNGSIGRF